MSNALTPACVDQQMHVPSNQIAIDCKDEEKRIDCRSSKMHYIDKDGNYFYQYQWNSRNECSSSHRCATVTQVETSLSMCIITKKTPVKDVDCRYDKHRNHGHLTVEALQETIYLMIMKKDREGVLLVN